MIRPKALISTLDTIEWHKDVPNKFKTNKNTSCKPFAFVYVCTSDCYCGFGPLFNSRWLDSIAANPPNNTT